MQRSDESPAMAGLFLNINDVPRYLSTMSRLITKSSEGGTRTRDTTIMSRVLQSLALR
jgi:hypothetical protein